MTADHVLQFGTHSPEQTRELAAAFASVCLPNDVIGLCGMLGAGKTCFVKGLAAGLGVCDVRQVISPTFVLMRRYVGRLALNHFDGYRLAGGADMEDIGCAEAFAEGGISVVEWADHVADCLPPERFTIEIDVVGPTDRRFRLSAGGGARRRLDDVGRALAPWRT